MLDELGVGDIVYGKTKKAEVPENGAIIDHFMVGGGVYLLLGDGSGLGNRWMEELEWSEHKSWPKSFKGDKQVLTREKFKELWQEQQSLMWPHSFDALYKEIRPYLREQDRRKELAITAPFLDREENGFVTIYKPLGNVSWCKDRRELSLKEAK